MTERSRVYGSSLYDLAAEEKLTEPIRDQMLAIKQILRDNPDYIRLLAEPSIKKAERIGLIDAAFGSSCEKYLVSFLKLLCERDLLGEYEGCCEIFTKRYNEDHNISEAVVTSAVALNDSQLKALAGKLETMSGKKITITTKIDPKVLAGIKVELDGKQLDGTVSGRLSGIRKKLDEVVM
ncbi:MAG: ATP synthase F1 subunit delta [Lachnospiraceae bacterium]|nr:ATP synthase F1 subunit delta [Lachnospiraceae bacterium]